MLGIRQLFSVENLEKAIMLNVNNSVSTGYKQLGRRVLIFLRVSHD